jgi:hypothetical protein
MRMLQDWHCELPYTAVTPWPLVERNGQPDWIDTVLAVELWLELHVGQHHQLWAWNTWALHQNHMCGVSFARARDSTLFLLRWG